MCGRYALMSSVDLLVELFSLAQAPGLLSGFAPRYNVAPTQSVPVVREDNGGRRMDALRWGLVPSWADNPAIGNRLINARSETAATKPSFRSAFKRRRCLVPVDGFYEWKKQDASTKVPHFIHMADRRPFALAGLWESWHAKDDPDAAPLVTFTVLTTTANALVRDLHDRMPVIVAPSDFERWLDRDEGDATAVADLLRPYDADAMAAYAVSRRVNSPRHDDPGCVAPATETPEADGLFS